MKKKTPIFTFMLLGTLLITGCDSTQEKSADSPIQSLPFNSEDNTTMEREDNTTEEGPEIKDINLSTLITDSVNIIEDNSFDYYQLDINETGIYTIYLESIPQGTNNDYAYTLDLQIFTTDKNYLDVAAVHYSLIGIGDEYATKEFEATEIGTYYFKVLRGRFGVTHDVPTNYKFHVEPSVANGLIQDEDNELNDVLSQATPLNEGNFTHYVNYELNRARRTDNLDWYELKDLKVGTYVFYMKTKVGTVFRANRDYLTPILYDEYGNEYVNLLSSTGRDIDKADGWIRTKFEVISSGSYFLKFSRESNVATNYEFKILPSVENGYIAIDNEANDEKELAISFDLNETNTTLVGSINITEVTDSDDWYVFTADSTSLTITVETLEGTQDLGENFRVSVFDEYDIEIKNIPNNTYGLKTANLSETAIVSLEIGKEYFIRASRGGYAPTRYKITLEK